MNNDALKYIIGQAISNVLAKTKKDYATLNEIYSEVAEIKNEERNKSLESQIRGRLQECCPQCSHYLGKDNFFQTKAIHSGLWKNRITGEKELTPYIVNIIKQYPGIDTVMIKSKLYQLVNLTPGDKAESTTRSGEMKIDQIMRNFVSHRDSHKEIKFIKKQGTYSMYYEGEDENTIDVDLYEKVSQEETVYDIISKENEKPENDDDNDDDDDVQLSFVTDELTPKKSKARENKIFIRKNDIETWLKREKSKIKNGNLAEGLVFAAEKAKLMKLNREDLAQKVKWISRDSGDGYGYDILSYELDKNNKEHEIHIEVKSTPNLNDDFLMSANELRYARENKDKYRLYRVAKIKSKNPVCKVIKGNLKSMFKFSTNEYKVSIKAKKD